MTLKEKIGNRIIAIFDGYTFYRGIGEIYEKENEPLLFTRDLKYHISLDALMPIINKIKKVSFELLDSKEFPIKIGLIVDIWANEAQFIDLNTKWPIFPITKNTDKKIPFITILWLQIIEFINWYNQL